MARPDLRVVDPLRIAPRGARPIAPESRLRSLFRTEARLEAELIRLRASIARERARYADKHRLAVFPSMDTLRRLFG